jgi:hypothetical protein
MTNRQLISEHRFTEGAVLSLAQLDPRRANSFDDGSRNQLLLGLGEARPWKGLLTKGASTGGRQMFQIGNTWGSLRDVGGTQGSGSFFEDIGKSRWFIGAGKPNVAGTDMGAGIAASTNLQVSIAVAGVYSSANTFTAGLPQPSAPDVGIVENPGAGFTGKVENPISFKIARLRLSTGARSIASRTSAVISPSKKSIRITFPLAATGQTDWRAFATQQGFGGVGLHYALPYAPGGVNPVLDIPESVVAASTVDGIARTLEFDFVDGDLFPEIAYVDDYASPAGTHAVRLENVMCVGGCYGDSSSAVTSTNPGTVWAISLPNFYESYKPRYQVYGPERPIAVMSRPSDSYAYVGCRNCVMALQYVGLRDGPAVAAVMIWPDIGIAKPHNWTQVQGLLYAYVAKGGPVRMLADGSPDYSFAAAVRKAMANWDPDDTIVGWHPDTLSVVWMNGRQGWSFSLQNQKWSPVCYFEDAGVTSGVALSCVNSAGELVITVNDAGAHTAYSWDKGATSMPITTVTPFMKPMVDPVPRSVRIRELMASFETDLKNTNSPVVFGVHRNQRQRYCRDVAITNGSNVVTSASSTFDADHVTEGDMVCVFGAGVGAGGKNYLLGRISAQGGTTLTIVDPTTGAALNAQTNASGLYALIGNQLLAYAVPRIGSQDTPFLDDFMVLDAQNYSISCNILTSATAGQVELLDVVGNPHRTRFAKIT